MDDTINRADDIRDKLSSVIYELRGLQLDAQGIVNDLVHQINEDNIDTVGPEIAAAAEEFARIKAAIAALKS